MSLTQIMNESISLIFNCQLFLGYSLISGLICFVEGVLGLEVRGEEGGDNWNEERGRNKGEWGGERDIVSEIKRINCKRHYKISLGGRVLTNSKQG